MREKIIVLLLEKLDRTDSRAYFCISNFFVELGFICLMAQYYYDLFLILCCNLDHNAFLLTCNITQDKTIIM